MDSYSQNSLFKSCHPELVEGSASGRHSNRLFFKRRHPERRRVGDFLFSQDPPEPPSKDLLDF